MSAYGFEEYTRIKHVMFNINSWFLANGGATCTAGVPPFSGSRVHVVRCGSRHIRQRI